MTSWAIADTTGDGASGASREAIEKMKAACAASADGRTKVTTEHKTTINGKVIEYSATVGFVEVPGDDGKSKACLFYTSYVAQGAGNRPLTFAFNGGPGSASLWLHMGFMGPQRVDIGSEGLTPTNQVITNENSPLDVTDIVMIDPVATGFSHAENGADQNNFFGVKNDYRSISKFIEGYLNANNRWLSPKFILGESYGGIRGTLLARHLQSDLGIGVAGVILISPALSWTSLDFTVDNNVPYWTFFPNFAASAWYHKKASTALQAMGVNEVYEAAKKFADSELRDALELGTSLGSSKFEAVAQSLHDFTGISMARLRELNLRVNDETFFSELMRDRRQIVGRFDSRYVGADPGVRTFDNDPSNANAFAFAAAINQYLRVDLMFPSTTPYTVVAELREWPYDSDGEAFGVLSDMARALADNPKLKFMIASGYYDLACPMGTVEYELSQLPGGAELRGRVSQTRYEGGHMMYINPAAAAQLKANMAAFIHSQAGTMKMDQMMLKPELP